MIFYFSSSDKFQSGINKSLLLAFENQFKLTSSVNQFVLLHTTLSSKNDANYSVQIVSPSLSVHMLEQRSETFLSIEKALLKKAAHYDYKNIIAKTFLISECTINYFTDDVMAPVSRFVFAMFQRKNLQVITKQTFSNSKNWNWEMIKKCARVHLSEER